MSDIFVTRGKSLGFYWNFFDFKLTTCLKKDFIINFSNLLKKTFPSSLVFCSKPLGYDSFITRCDRLGEMNTVEVGLPIEQEVIPK